jgi:4'-phosphopantetheinyl transferase
MNSFYRPARRRGKSWSFRLRFTEARVTLPGVVGRRIPAGSIQVFPLTREGQQIDTVFGFVFTREYPALVQCIAEFLASPEAAYFAALHFLRRQQSFLLGRYAAKLALQYALQAPDLKAIEIGRGVFEQPVVSHLSAKTPGVTISHCSEIAVALAFPAGHPMGVDIERIDPARMTTIQSQLSPTECAWTRSAAADEITLSTLIWTAKEALSKALTCGLMSPMEILNLSEFYPLGNSVWEGLFQNFAQYRFVGWTSRTLAMSVVLPKKSKTVGPGLDFDAVISRR